MKNWTDAVQMQSISFFFSSRRRHTRLQGDWSSDVCSSDLFRSLPNKIGYLLGLPTKKLDMIIYYERYVVINAGIKAQDGINYLDFLTEEEYLHILEALPKDNQHLEDNDPNKFIEKMHAEALYDLLSRLNLDELSFSLRDQANNETSQQRKNEALKRLNVVEAFRAA